MGPHELWDVLGVALPAQRGNGGSRDRQACAGQRRASFSMFGQGCCYKKQALLIENERVKRSVLKPKSWRTRRQERSSSIRSGCTVLPGLIDAPFT